MCLDDVAAEGGLPLCDVEATYGNMRSIAIAILDAEGASMRTAQQVAILRAQGQPLDVLRHTFRIVGRNMQTMPVVRAGMRLAIESHEQFPERNIDPYRTWRAFILAQLSDARDQAMLNPEVDIEAVTWLLVSSGMGTKELVSFTGAWDEVSQRLDVALDTVLGLISTNSEGQANGFPTPV
ncbi:hypothetical protein M1D88_09825 [Arthrobacter sp. R1-13]